ncbi:exodeoxyribonuclease V subunit beta [Pseudoalteromonas fenneropenaei]|uniref:RecBCD enzyme subunit RecB n=1 Tax=Pseudoalteromonas fenneropenaei TaxID=1737459 RepID=A0ABV7CQ30_9GAMM
MQILDAKTMPLVGEALIEASAGTGKTYTISGLYLRYLLGLYGQDNASPALAVEQILVVTFTEAATQEIKDRVRKRIVLARDALLGEPCSDDLVNSVLSTVSDTQQAFLYLDAAAKSMDEAAIFTIHGFCQRMLKQHAFESNLAFNQTFVLDQQQLLLTAVRDHWRRFVYPLDLEHTELVLAQFATPEKLLKALQPLLHNRNAELEPKVELTAVLAARTRYRDEAAQFKQALLSSDFIAAISSSDINGNSAPKRKANLAALQEYCESEQWFFEFGSAGHSFATWSSSALAEPSIYKKNGQPFSHALLVEFDRFAALHDCVTKKLPLALLQQAKQEVLTLLQTHKQQYAILTPDDLLEQFLAALSASPQGALSEKIAQCYPAAMIDEFQDTDPVQYGIFSHIYGSKTGEARGHLTMIGDPKQAIYGFRGADIFTYIQAKQAVAEAHHYTLATNYRSTAAVVDAVNRIFNQHTNSFIYNRDIPFVTVAAKGKAAGDVLKIAGDVPAALHFTVLMDNALTTPKNAALPQLAAIFASKIAKLLSDAQQGQASVAGRAVAASDICVLVRDRQEASAIKLALQKVGVASVYLSRDSVFNQPITLAVLRFLQVLHGPYDEAALRGVLAGPLFALRDDELFALQSDELRAQAYLQQFADLRRSWERVGAMAMLEQLLVDNRLAQLWQQQGAQVERLLTDYRHLAELIQHKQLELEGTERVLRWLHSQVCEPDGEGTQLRLESDAELVKVVTMHASKGLEYPIVYLPFASQYREASNTLYHRSGELILDLDPTDESRAAAEQERLAEDIRLLYVALTRAVYYCELGMFNLPQGRSKNRLGLTQTAIGYVLFGNQEFAAKEDWHAALAALCASEQFGFELLDQAAQHTYQGKSVEIMPTSVRPVTAYIERHWRATSFSQLTYHAGHDERPAGAVDENHLLDLPMTAANTQLNSYTFPKGAKAGSCLHEIFELIDFCAPDAPLSQNKLSLPEAVTQSLEKYQLDSIWQQPAQDWLHACLHAPLSAALPELRLAALKPAQCLVEMEFHLPLLPLQATKLNKLLTEVTGQPCHLQFEQVQGLLKGFIDLLFEWQGRYYVLDYKSNYLGDKPSDYERENLEVAMQAHHYHLQYILYTVALHRLLRNRLRDYQPATHLGGVFYLFLRALPDGMGVYETNLTLAQLDAFDALFLDPQAEAL